MKNWIKRILGFEKSPIWVPFLLMTVTVTAYGLILSKLGFYWDDFPMSWIRYQLGPEAMSRYFANNRPYWGMLYQVTTRLLPYQPFAWQLFALFWRWVTGILIWGIMRQVWPKQPHLVLGASLFFLLYPGFNQQWVSYLYSHFFIVLSFFLFSLLCMLWSIRPAHRRLPFWSLTVLGMLGSILNLWMMEYFFVLELFRPFLLWFGLRERIPDFRKRFRRLIVIWLPYLFVFIAAALFRVFVFNNQVYQANLLPKLRAGPIAITFTLVQTILTSFWTVSAAAWSQVFRLINPTVEGPRTTAVYAVVVLVNLLLAIGFFFRLPQDADINKNRWNKDGLWVLGLGLVAMFMAGWPFWMIDFPVTLGFPANRFTLPFMLGSSLFVAGLIELIPFQIMRSIITALLVSLAAGRQFLWANEYRLDWNTQKNLFWQLSWRIPKLQTDTLLLMNEGAFNYYADNSLSAPLNWIYAPENRSAHVNYLLLYPTSRLGGSLPTLEEGLPVQHDFFTGRFSGNTSQAVVIYYLPPSCLRVLDPEIDQDNRLIPDQSLLREAAHLSKTAPILDGNVIYLPEVYDPEPPHLWCYYFEKADLARQLGDWEQVADLGDQAFQLNDYPNDPVERFVFIEGYGHIGNWDRAYQLSITSYNVSPSYVGPLLCSLWKRIDRTIPDGPEKSKALSRAQIEFHCST